MADNPELKVIITAEIESLKKAVSETKDELKSLGNAQEEAAGRGGTLKEATDAVGDTLDKVKGVTGKAIKGTKALATSFKGAGTGAKAGAAGMKAFKAALISTGIGALIVILGELVANWDKIEAAVSPAGKALEKYNDELDRLSSKDKVFDSQLKAIRAQIKLRETLGENADDLKEEEKKILIAKQAQLVAQRATAYYALETTKAKALELQLLDKIAAAALLAKTGSTKGFLPTITTEEIKAIDDAQIELNNLDGTIASITNTIALLNQEPIEPKVKNPFKGLIKGTEAYIKVQIQQATQTRANKATSHERYVELTEDIQNATNALYILQNAASGEPREAVVAIKTDAGLGKMGRYKPLEETDAETPKIIDAGVTISNELLNIQNQMKMFNDDMDDLVQNSLIDTFSGVGEAIGQALGSGGNVLKAVGISLLKSMGQYLSKMGAMLIGYGKLSIAKGKIDVAMAIGGPVAIAAGGAAIATGIALLAAGAAIGAAAGALSSSGGGSSSAAGAGVGASRQSNMDASTYKRGDGQSYEFKAQGTELVAVLNNSRRRQNALGGTQLTFG